MSMQAEAAIAAVLPLVPDLQYSGDDCLWLGTCPLCRAAGEQAFTLTPATGDWECLACGAAGDQSHLIAPAIATPDPLKGDASCTAPSRP